MEHRQEQPYLMSFGTGGLYINESVAIARLHVAGRDWESTMIDAQERGAFPVRKASSARRSIREIVNRLKHLSSDELALLIEGERSEQAALLWLAACRLGVPIQSHCGVGAAPRTEGWEKDRTDLTDPSVQSCQTAQSSAANRSGLHLCCSLVCTCPHVG